MLTHTCDAITLDGLRQETFTVREAAAFAGVTPRKVRKELETGVIPPTNPPRLCFSSLVSLYALHFTEEALGTPSVQARKHIHQSIAAALGAGNFDAIRLGDFLIFELKSALDTLAENFSGFRRWQDRLVTDPDILGGETVFPQSRLSVQHIGGILERGEPPEHVLEDYPYLTQQDLDFARIYVRAYPRVGRPPKLKAATR